MKLFQTSGVIISAIRDVDFDVVYYLAEWTTSGAYKRFIRNAAKYSDWRDFAKEAMTEYFIDLTAAVDKLYED
jgi:hypothetical protein